MRSRSVWRVLGRTLALVLVELEVAVSPVDRPLAGRPHGAQPRDRKQRVLAADPIPGRAHLDDVDVPVGDVGFDLHLVLQVLGHALPHPEADAVQVSLGKRHHTSVPLGEQRRVWRRKLERRRACGRSADRLDPRARILNAYWRIPTTLDVEAELHAVRARRQA